MHSDTYEITNTKQTLETYEWDRLWIDHPYDTDARRVLYIGDSISYATRSVLAKQAIDLHWDGFATSKAVDNPFFPDTLRLLHAQAPAPDVLLFNNGLHGWHLEDETEYAEAYESILCFLLEEWKGAQIGPVLTTCLANEERNARVQKRNEAVRAMAERHSLPVLDLYSVSLVNRDKISADGVHFTEQGYERLSDTILDFLKKQSS